MTARGASEEIDVNRRDFTKAMAALLANSGQSRYWIDSSRYPGGSNDEFNVKDFGAIGDSVSDDTRAFERAIMRAAKTGGGTVTVPSGRFRVKRTLHLGTGISLRGISERSIIDHREGEPIIILAVDAKKLAIRNLKFSGLFAFAILVERSRQITIDNCHISGGRTPWLSSSYCGGIFLTQSDDVMVKNNVLSGNGQIRNGILSSDIQVNGFGDAIYSRGIQIINNRCTSLETQCSIAAYDLQNSVISDNTCVGAKTGPNDNNGYGILIYQRPGSPDSCKNNTVARNKVQSTGGTGIYLQKCHHSRVIQNILSDVALTQNDQTLPVGGIALNQSEFVDIQQNRIERAGKAGISIASNRPGVGHVTVTRNVLIDVDGMGVHLRGPLIDIKVSGNSVRRARGGIGSFSEDPQEDIELIDNTVSETTASSPGIILGNAGKSVVRNNRISDSGGYGLAVTLRDSVSDVSGNTVVGSGRAFKGKYPNVRIVRPNKPVISQ